MRTLVIAGSYRWRGRDLRARPGCRSHALRVHGFGSGIGREVAHSMLGHHRW